jgi:hypothetical protein
MNTVDYLEKKFGPHKGNPHKLEGLVRDDMYKMFAELGFTKGVEIGIEKGKNAQTMFEIIPNLKLYGVDPYQQHPHASYAHDATLRHWDSNYLEGCKRQCLNRMKDRNFTLMQGFSENMADKLEDNSVDFVYLDADHSYDMVMLDIIKWGRKIRKGGIISGHDYYYENNKEARRAKVTQALNDYTTVHGIKFYITDENHAKLKGDIYPSWFWVKLEDIWPNLIRT